MSRTAYGLWRRVLVCALAYALVLQGFILALDTAQAAVGTASAGRDVASSEFPLCSHGGTAPTGRDAPLRGPLNNSHCIFCIGGTVYVHCAPPAVPQLLGSVLAERVISLAVPTLLAVLVNQIAWPRGPPAAA
jgi:hypothetical protein